MPTHAAFLRAVNLGRQRQASSEALRELFEGEGFDDVATFRTSGNVVFGAPRASREQLATRIERALERALGFDVVVFLRTAKEVRAVAGHEPFDGSVVDGSKGKLQVALLPERPGAAVRKQVVALARDEDRLAFEGRELYWLPSGGTQRSALDLAAIAELVGPWTMRTKATIEQLAAKFFD
jgi:uncharacterized protein (DUF1697 family)